MLAYEIPPLTLATFADAQDVGLGDWLDPLVFLRKFREMRFVARASYHVAVFEGERPTFGDFLNSIEGDDLKQMRESLINAYINFFPSPMHVAIRFMTEALFPDINAPPLMTGDLAQ